MILSERQIQKLLGSKSLGRLFGEKSYNRLPSFHLTPKISLRQMEIKTVTKWIGLQPNEIFPVQPHAFSIPPHTSPLSFALEKIKPKEKLISPLYMSPEFIDDHYNDNEYSDLTQLFTNGFRINKEKELVIIDNKAIEIQKSVLGDVFKQFTMAIFTGKELTSISLPIKIMEPLSQVTSYSRLFSNLKQLELAGKAEDPLEVFKHTISFACSNLYYSINYFKPMNPYMGETMQGYFTEGTQFYAEKISHNPPICAYFMINERLDFSLSFSLESHFEMSSNEIKNFFKGIACITIKGQKIYYSLPNMWARGIMYGKNTTGFENYFFFHYPEKNMKAFVRVGNSRRADGLEGAILNSDESLTLDKNKFSSNLFIGSKPKLSSFTKNLAAITGGFTEALMFDNVEYWNTSCLSFKVQMNDDALPSDWRFREDLLWMTYENIGQAQDWKLKLEGIQREWRKQREDFAKSKIVRSKK